jgi:flagellar protein FliO/FliZ
VNRLRKGLLALPLLALTGLALAADPVAPAVAPVVTTSVVTTPVAPAMAPAAAPVVTSVGPALSSAMSNGLGGQLLQLVLGLLLVLGLIFALAWLMRRVQRAGPGGNQVIQLLGSRALGPRDRLVLVQVGKEQVLLGVSPGSITALHVLNEPVEVPVAQNATPEFAKRLMEAMGGKGLASKGFGDKGPKDNH